MATTTQFETAQIDDLTRDGGWTPLRRHFDVRAFGINAWTADEAGKTVIGEHDEERSGQEELYLVLSGKATLHRRRRRRRGGAGHRRLRARSGREARRGRRRARDDDPRSRRHAGRGVPPAGLGAECGDLPALRCRRGRGGEAPARGRARPVRGQRAAGLQPRLRGGAPRRGRARPSSICVQAIAERASFAELARKDDDFAALRGDARFEEIVGATPG